MTVIYKVTNKINQKNILVIPKILEREKIETWKLYDSKTKQIIIIDDLIEYSILNNIKYKTLHSWKYQMIDNQPRLQKV